MLRGLQLCAQDVYHNVPRSIHNHLPARNPTAQTAFWPFWKFSVLLISRGGEMILNSICNMKTISYFDWEPCFQQNNVFFWISLHKWWGRSFFCKLMDSNSWYRGVWWKVFFQSWSAFSDQLGCNPWWWRSPTLFPSIQHWLQTAQKMPSYLKQFWKAVLYAIGLFWKLGISNLSCCAG